MATGGDVLGGGAYNNGIVPYKRYVLGEAYTRDKSEPASGRQSGCADAGDDRAAAYWPSCIRCRAGR